MPSFGHASDPHDYAAYEQLVKSHRAALERLARRLARDAEDAEDLLQETLVDAFRAFRNFRADSHFYGWVARIMTNNHLDRIRRKSHPVVSLDQEPPSGSAPLDLPDESQNPERVLLRDELDHPLQSALDALQPVQRATVLLCDLGGATYEEAARAEDCPIGTIRSRLHRAHAAIRQFLSRIEPSPAPASRRHSRRAFLAFGTAAAAGAALSGFEPDEATAAEAPVRVLVWTGLEGPASAYPEGVGAAVADAVGTGGNVQSRVSRSTDSGEGLGEEALSGCDVLVLWGSASLSADRVAAVMQRVHDGMGLIALHGAAESEPFRRLLGGEVRRADSNRSSVTELRITAPRHPVAAGLHTFHLVHQAPGGLTGAPTPEVVLLDDPSTAPDPLARQGMVWTVGRGRIFYFQPGDEASPVFHHPQVRQLLRNALHWCARRTVPAQRTA